MSKPSPPQNRSGFKVAIICALPLEANYVQSTFDRCWDDEGQKYRKALGDKNAYTTGVIGEHNVVLVHMPNMGSISASAVAANVATSFPAIQLGLVVGICGALPIHAKTKKEIILGDIIISTTVIQYDFGRLYPDGFERKKEIEDSLGRANREIRAVAAKLESRPSRKRLENQLRHHLLKLQSQASEAKYPGMAQDRLYEASYIHEHRSGSNSCEKCKDTIGTCSKSCDELGCEKDKLVLRERLHLPESPSTDMNIEHAPSVHFGRFGSANSVMKSGVDRDRIGKDDGVIAFEMEGAGVWDELPTMVIKAVCAYADSHNNKEWQEYAAATAAACVKAFLGEWIMPDQLSHQDELSGPVWHVPFDRGQGFVGRTEELKRLKEKISQPDSRRIVSVLGLGGIGKSRLALEIAYRIHVEHPQHSIFWIQATEQLTFEKDVLEIGKKLRIPGIEDDKADVKALVKQRLNNSSTGPWLLILDNADDETRWGEKSSPDNQESTLVDWLPSTTNGLILITTRSRRVASYLAGREVTEVHAMSPDEASQMLINGLERPDLAANRDATSSLLEKLTYLPLAIIQAASYMNMTQEPVQTYLELLDEAEADIIKLLSRDFGDPSRYPKAKNPVATTWLISFEHISEHNQLAATYLSYMACLLEKNIPLSLLPKADSKLDMIEAIAVLKGYSFVKKHTGSGGGNDHEILYDMHRLVYLATRNWLKMKGSLDSWMKACIAQMARLFPRRDHKHKNTWTVYMPHGQRLCADRCVKELAERYDLLEKMGLCSLIDGKYNEAVEMHNTVVQWREDNLGTSKLQTLDAYNNLGEALDHKGDWSLAEKYLQRALKGKRDRFGREHPSTLSSMANLASTYGNQGRWKEAEELNVQVMETRKRVLGKEHPSTLISMANLAFTWKSQKRDVEALELMKACSLLRKQKLGAEHPDTISSFRALSEWETAAQAYSLRVSTAIALAY